MTEAKGPDPRKLNMLLGIAAVFILVISFSAFAYTNIPKGDTGVVVIGGAEFAWSDIESDYDVVSFVANEKEYEGVLLASLIIDSGIPDYEGAEYVISGSDGYQKNVGWESMETGYLVFEDKRTVFPELTQSYWVRDVISIETV